MFGRRLGVMVTCPLFCSGYLCFWLAKNTEIMFLGRIFTGAACGLQHTAVSSYLSEVNIRYCIMTTDHCPPGDLAQDQDQCPLPGRSGGDHRSDDPCAALHPGTALEDDVWCDDPGPSAGSGSSLHCPGVSSLAGHAGQTQVSSQVTDQAPRIRL